MKNLPRLLGNTVEIPFETPASPDRDKIHAIEDHLAAAGRFKEHFGITVDSDFLVNTLTAATDQERLAAQLKAHDISILSSRAVSAYQEKRIRTTPIERYVEGWKGLANLFEKYMMHGLSGTFSAFCAFFLILPIVIPAIVAWHWYTLHYSGFYFLMMMLEGAFVMSTGNKTFEKDGKLFARLNYWLIGLLLKIVICPFAPWLMKIDMGRKWKQVSVRELLGGKTSWQGPIAVLDAVAQAVPDETLLFEVCKNSDGTRDKEVFLGVQIKGTEGGLLYVWHGQV